MIGYSLKKTIPAIWIRFFCLHYNVFDKFVRFLLPLSLVMFGQHQVSGRSPVMVIFSISFCQVVSGRQCIPVLIVTGDLPDFLRNIFVDHCHCNLMEGVCLVIGRVGLKDPRPVLLLLAALQGGQARFKQWPRCDLSMSWGL